MPSRKGRFDLRRHAAELTALAILAAGCVAAGPPVSAGLAPQRGAADAAPERPAPGAETAPRLGREDFNRLAALLDQPLFWQSDDRNPGQLDPDELVLLGIRGRREAYLDPKGQLGPLFFRTLAAMKEIRRREAVRRELDQGRPTLVRSDFRSASEQDRAIARHISAAAWIIEELYGLQAGSFGYRGCMHPDDRTSQALFRRNQSPWCVAPETERDPFCNACPGFPQQRSGLYPAALQQKESFCELLGKEPNAEQLLSPFSVVEDKAGGGFEAVPYHRAYADRMKRVAAELRATAEAISEGEEALRKYLLAAASGFESDEWGPADEAWAAMSSSNSRWYLRIGPDEVYFEPCNRKAGFHVSFARIDPDSVFWQQRLTPLRQEMEQVLAAGINAAAGKEIYAAREVSVHMPDFIEIVLNAGDARSPMGATIGQSLPNWGKVAEEGRGRTVVMSNLYTDPDSLAIRRAQADSVLAAESLSYYTDEKRLNLLDIILHEITHNLGPHSDYKLDGKRPGDIFGGATATVLEELKAQTGALYYIDFLRKKKLLGDEEARKVYLHAIIWCFGHISRGLFDSSGRPKPYSQVAAIHVGFLAREGAMRWLQEQPAANVRDKGCFQLDFDRFAAAFEKLMVEVGRIKAAGDLNAARALIDDFTKGAGLSSIHQPEIAERLLRHPKASFVYSIQY
ncbi:MAG: hypothetical protein JXR96_23215 [Deltaproteobacteria bacterium]|nr:hypothetical protein [Deltaproteobacteria bacterium]